MKKILSVLLAVIIMVTSCVCALTVFAADDCSKGHTVTKWFNNSKNNHLGYCDVCGETVKKAHELYVFETVQPSCLADGYTRYKCLDCSYAVNADTVNKLGHDIISVTYNYDLNNDGKFDDSDIYYERTIDCRNGAQCDFTSEKGTVGASNYCPGCEKRMLIKKTIVSSTCQSASYTIYYCSNPDCDPEFRLDASTLAEHRYVSETTAPTCTEEGYTEYTCVFCKGSYKDQYIPATGHSLDAAGETYSYVYNVDGVEKCQITGKCAVCNVSIVETKTNTPAEKCDKCSKSIYSKTVAIPANCEDSAVINISCSCGSYEVTALPVGHSVKTATYLYNDDGSVDVSVDCYACNVTTTADAEYLDDTACVKCATKIQKRVVVSSTCSTNGYVKVTCPECGVYTESAKSSYSHAASFAEWTFDRTAGILTFKADCERDGCNGYTYTAAIGTAGMCSRCGRDSLLSKRVKYQDCTSEGYTDANCSYCGVYSGYDPKDLLSHNSISYGVKATCVEGGCVKSTCRDCFYTTETNKTDALGHTGGVTAVSYNSSTGKKTTTGYCDRCDGLYTQTSSIYYGENICSKCGGANITSKAIVKPDCKSGTSGYTAVSCKSCGNYDTDIITAQHSYGSWVITLEATCVEAGKKERVCSLCDSIEIDIIPANQTTDGNPKHQYVLMVKGYAATCTEDGLSDEMYCASCGEYKKSEVIPATGHSFDPESTNKDFCSRCNSYVIGEGDAALVCDCICHNRDGLAAFFFKIIIFFCQILGINQKCDCGTIHY